MHAEGVVIGVKGRPREQQQEQVAGAAAADYKRRTVIAQRSHCALAISVSGTLS